MAWEGLPRPGEGLHWLGEELTAAGEGLPRSGPANAKVRWRGHGRGWVAARGGTVARTTYRVRGRRKEKKRTVHFPLIGGVVGNFYQQHEIRFLGASLEVLRGFDGSES